MIEEGKKAENLTDISFRQTVQTLTGKHERAAIIIMIIPRLNV